MKLRSRKLIAAMLTVSMCTIIFTGCGKINSDDSAQLSTDEAKSEVSESEESEETSDVDLVMAWCPSSVI